MTWFEVTVLLLLLLQVFSTLVVVRRDLGRVPGWSVAGIVLLVVAALVAYVGSLIVQGVKFHG